MANEKIVKMIKFSTTTTDDDTILQLCSCSECNAIAIFRISDNYLIGANYCPNCGNKVKL